MTFRKPTNLAEFLLRSIVVRAKNRDTELQNIKEIKEKFKQIMCSRCESSSNSNCDKCGAGYCSNHLHCYNCDYGDSGDNDYCMNCAPEACKKCSNCNQLAADIDVCVHCGSIFCFNCYGKLDRWDKKATVPYICGKCY